MNIKGKPIFNFNFSTDVLFRCIQRKYATDFINGKIRFSKPSNWIEIEKNGNKGQGDILEGVFLSTKVGDKSKFIKNLKCNKNIESFEDDKLVYFRNKSSLNLYSLCLYGLNDNSFVNEYVDRFKEKHYRAIIGKEYFSAFNTICSESDYFKIEEDERPCVIFITNPHMFFEKIKKFFIDLGVPKNDILIQPVEYVDYSVPFFDSVNPPMELFIKDKYFSYQSEIRIVINSKLSILNEYMENNNWVIDIGDISNYASIYDNYFHDLLLEKNGNELYFTLPFPEEYDLRDLSLKKLLSIYIQTYNNKLPDEKTNEEIKEILCKINEIIENKYKIYISVENNQVIINNPNNVDIDSMLKD